MSTLNWRFAMLRRREIATIAFGAVLASAWLGWIGHTCGWTSDTMASWVQALGSIAAILLVTLPVVLAQRIARNRGREVVLASCEMAFGVMSEVADRYIDPGYVGSEWWVPQWDILRQTLADCPIHDTGSGDALRAFVSFQELFSRAEAFADPPLEAGDGPLNGLVGFIMTNAAYQLDLLRKALGAAAPPKGE